MAKQPGRRYRDAVTMLAHLESLIDKTGSFPTLRPEQDRLRCPSCGDAAGLWRWLSGRCCLLAAAGGYVVFHTPARSQSIYRLFRP